MNPLKLLVEAWYEFQHMPNSDDLYIDPNWINESIEKYKKEMKNQP